MNTTYRSVLHIDIETYCDLDLKQVGVYAYASHPSFAILLLAYCYDNEPVKVLDLTTELLPHQLFEDLFDEQVLKVAHNAAFEITCLREYTGSHFEPSINASQWDCTMVKSLQCGLPASLAQVGSVLRLEQQKMQAGTLLINYFSKPCKPSKSNGQRTRNLPIHDTEKWEVFKEYCAMDVEVEREIFDLLNKRVIQPSLERDLWLVDQAINDRGILLDAQLVDSAIEIDSAITEKHMQELQEITGKSNPKSNPQFKQYLTEIGIQVNSFTKKDAIALLSQTKDPILQKAIILKLALSKSSNAKYDAMQRAVGADGRVRGLFQYYGANRTGRWAGRLVQMQNLPQNHLEELDMTRELVKGNDLCTLQFFYESVPDTLSQLIRTAFVAKKDTRFIVADYSAIEARVIAWLADEKWRLEVFKENGDIYCASASQMFKVPVIKHGENGDLRQKGKIAELALGYGGGVGSLKSMGALEMGMGEKELQPLVDSWRNSNKKIKGLWYEVNSTIQGVLDTGLKLKLPKNMSAYLCGKDLVIELPSKRKLVYVDAKVMDGRISYAGLNQVSRKWERVDTFGGKLVENIVQAIARDCLALALLNLEDLYPGTLVGHVHDEVILEADSEIELEEVCDIMGAPISWAPGLVLNADGYETPYYKKD